MKTYNLTVFSGIILLLSSSSGFLIQSKNALKQEKPNVMLVMTDDQGYGDLGLHGNQIIETPILDSFSGSRSGLRIFMYRSPVLLQ